MKRVPKGEWGYIKSEKKWRLIITVSLFILPVLAFVLGLIIAGTTANILSVIAMVGMLPGCRAIVALVMMLPRQPLSEADYNIIKAHENDELVVGYELYLTAYEKSALMEAFAICGNRLVGLMRDPKADLRYETEHLSKMIRANVCAPDVKLYNDINVFTKAMDSMSSHPEAHREGVRYQVNEDHPELELEDLIYQTLLSISL
ncbi:MAG: hypothetical protein KBS83_02800 [Lachnospiraceae bacterium]|nr:hypothetical protein [Candidatus Equihabitans merdae]